ncbi:MAG: ArsA family ATPase, partial [Ignavibacteriales bacterium]|nr:ArsA family ATPase [Ignavibacteriales bacterium]
PAVHPACRSLAVKVYCRPNLFGMEIDVETTLADFKLRYGGSIRNIINHGTYLDDIDISSFLELSFPGLDEVMAIVQITELLEDNRYDIIILDTAPTGHTVKLLTLPHLMEKWVAFLDTLMLKHRFLSQLYANIHARDHVDDFIAVMRNGIGKVQAHLQDGNRCQFVPVTNLEPMVLAETKNLLETLSTQNISVPEIIVNKVLNPTLCTCPQSVTEQKEIIDLLDLAKRYGAKTTVVPHFPFEVRGEVALKVFAQSALGGVDGPSIGKSCATKNTEHRVNSPDRIDTRMRSRQIPVLRINDYHVVQLKPPAPGAKLILFGGKGGVGKTTIATSFAINLASVHPEERILLFSTDPAHSLSDCLGQAVGDKVTAIDGTANLFAVEIEARERFERFKDAYTKEINEVFDGFVHDLSIDIEFDREVMGKLMELTPPGLHEIMSLIELAKYVERGEYDRYVLDNAPTGHALRFLELPDLMQAWLRVLFEVLLKYRSVLRLCMTSELLVTIHRKTETIRRIFSDPGVSEFIPVSIPERMALSETQRLVSALQRLGIPVKRMFMNKMIAKSVDCKFCSVQVRQQEKVLSEHKQAFPEIEITTFPRAILGSRQDLCRLLEFSSLDEEADRSNKWRFGEKFISTSAERSFAG